MEEDTAVEVADYEAEIERNLSWNLTVNVADGALYWFGLSFAAPSTIMPLYVSHLTDSRMLVGLVAAISGAGWYLPQLLTANYVERLPVKKDMVVRLGLFSERMPFLVMTASVFLFAGSEPNLALLLFFLTLTWHTVGAGLVAIAWQDMVAKVIPVHYRGRMLGMANALGAAAGMAGAAAAAAILARYPFPINFGLCMSLLCLFMFASWFAVSLTREPPKRSTRPSISLREYGKRLPAVLRQDRNFAAYLLSRVLSVLGRMGVGFVTVYAVRRWNLTDSQAGLYTTVLLAGETLANLGAGALADGFGHKLVLELSLGLAMLSMGLAALAPSPAWMYAVFGAIGALLAADIISSIMISMEFAAPEDRPTYMGLANTIPGLFSAAAPLVGGWIASRANYPALFAIATLLSLAAWATLHWWVKDPRAVAAIQG